MDLHLAGRSAIVCASTDGLGRATAVALAADGCRVAVVGRRADVAESLSRELGGGAVAIPADLTQPGAVSSVVQTALDAFDAIDIVVLNGPGPAPGRADALDAATVRAAMTVLLDNHIELVNRTLPAMRERGWGRILAIGSSGVEVPLPNLAASNIGRAALAAYLKTLSAEVAADGVTVNLLLPGRIATSRVAALDTAAAERTGTSLEDVQAASRRNIPAGRYGQAAEFGAVAAFLCSGQASYVTGTSVRCDGGLVPTL